MDNDNGYFCTRCKEVTTKGVSATVQPSECGPITFLVCPRCKDEMRLAGELIADIIVRK